MAEKLYYFCPGVSYYRLSRENDIYIQNRLTLKNYFFLLFLITAFGCNSQKNETTAEVSTDTKNTNTENNLKQSILKYPDSTLLVENLAQYYQEQGNYESAINTIAQKAETDNQNHRWYNMMGWLYYEMDDTTKAITNYEKAIDLYPDPQYVISLGALYAGRGNPQALAMADALLMADKANVTKEGNFIKGLYYDAIGDKKQAISYYDKCLAESYSFVNAYLQKGLALIDLNKMPEALEAFNKGIAVQNNFPEAYFYKGYVLEQMKKPEEAKDAYAKALLYDSQYTEATNALNRLNKTTIN